MGSSASALLSAAVGAEDYCFTAAVGALSEEDRRKLILQLRAGFTQQVDQAIKDGTTSTVLEDVKSKRRALSAKMQTPALFNDLPKDCRLQALSILTLLHEQQHTASGLPDNWADELKIYEEDGKYKAVCGGIELPVGSDLPPAARQLLVVTPLSREARKVHFKAASSGKILTHNGPPGTGKTETFKDTCLELCTEPMVFSISEKTTMADVKEFLAGSKGKPFAFEEVDKMKTELLEEFLQAAKELGSLVCCISHFSEVPTPLVDNSISMDFTIPPFSLIIDVMLSSQGFTESEAVAEKFCAFREELQQKLGPVQHLDLGLRMMKGVCVFAGQMGRVLGFSDQVALIARVVHSYLYPCLDAAQKEELVALVNAHFGSRPALPEGWPNCLVMLKDILKIRHAAVLMGVDADADACLAALGETAKGEGCEVARMPGTLTDGPIDGSAVAKTLEPAVEDGKKVWVVFIMGECTEEKPATAYLKCLHSVMDDNKALCLPGGKRIALNPDTRIVILTKDVKTWTPASISRCGIVFADGDKGW